MRSEAGALLVGVCIGVVVTLVAQGPALQSPRRLIGAFDPAAQQQVRLHHHASELRGPPPQGSHLFSKDLTPLFTGVLNSAKYIDLTHAFSPKIPVWKGFGPISTRASVAGASMDGFIKKSEQFTYEKHGFIATAYTLTTDQLGTQLDPPAHWNELGATISDIPPTVAVRPLAVVDVSTQTAKDPSYQATVADVRRHESKHGRILEGSVVFFRSGWSKTWANCTATGAGESCMPPVAGVSLGALKYLHNIRRILFHGHEALDTDNTTNLEGEAWLMHNDFAQAEGIANLDLVMPAGCLVTVGFAKPLRGTGGYARYVAVCPSGWRHGMTISEAPGAPLPKQPAPLRRDGKTGVLAPDASAAPTQYCQGGGNPLGCSGGKLVK